MENYLENPEILTEKISEERKDPFWYRGKEIARIQFPNGTKLYAEAQGEIRIQFEEGGVHWKGQKAVEEAFDRGFTDDDLAALYDDDLIDMSNWFVIIKVDINGEVVGDDLAIGDDYDHAIELLKECAKEENPYKEI
jgi:hypothetical protein